MNQKYLKGLSILLAFLTIAACSVLKKEDPEKEIKLFLNTFENNLSLSDADIVKQFDTKQSNQSILSVIKILQNKDLSFMECIAQYGMAELTISDGGASAKIPVTLKSKSLEVEYTRETSLTLWLKVKGNSFAVTKLEGEEFYNAYASLKNEMEWSVSKKELLIAGEPLLAKARALQEKYDSVIWFANYQGRTYFYVVNGTWDIGRYDDKDSTIPLSHQMGLVDENGSVIIPVEYELIGNPGLVGNRLFEVKKDGKVGYINLDGKTVIEPSYDMIIPYEGPEIFALAKNDSSYGWINSKYEYQAGIGQDERTYIRNYKFIPDDFKISAEDQNLCQVPNEEYFGYGVFISPSSWVKSGMFNQAITGLVTEEMSMTAFREYIETKKTFFENVSDQVSALITTMRERYLEGREEFYTHHQLVIVNANLDTLASTDKIWGIGEFSIKRHGDIIEIKSITKDDEWYYEEGPFEKDYNIPSYTYFQLQEDKTVTAMESNRRFNNTEFIKLDSSYISGDFQTYNTQTESLDPSSFLKTVTLNDMRNEILASYGYRFPDAEFLENYKASYSWYQPRFETLLEIQDQLTEIDKHNLAFLERIIGPLKENTSI